MSQQFFRSGLGLFLLLSVFSSGFAIEPHCYNVTKTVEIVYREAEKTVSLKFIWDASLIGGTVGVIFGTVTDRAGKCIAERAMTIMLPTNAKHCPRFTGYESWCENETRFSVKKNANGSLELIVKFSVQSMLRYLGNVTVNNTVLFSSRLQYSYLSTNESASDLTTQVLVLGGPKERENTSAGILNPCQSSPCLNNATCEGMHWKYNCTCMEGFWGRNCEQGILNPCQSSPCLNNATCEGMHLKYNCTCMEGFWGRNCEQGGSSSTEVPPSKAQISGKKLPSYVIALIVISIALVLLILLLLYVWLKRRKEFKAMYRRIIRKGTQVQEPSGVAL